MGKVIVKTKLWNFCDEVEVRKGLRKPEEIRSVEVDALVDTGATMVSLPKKLVEALGLLFLRETTVTYADGRREKKNVATGLNIEILGRLALTDCLVEELETKVLIGQIPLEEMDLIVDPKNGAIGPRPESPDMPLIEML
ncbi:MAG: retroviral-like aspartic protease family protein [Elusimicrobiota bacterium]